MYTIPVLLIITFIIAAVKKIPLRQLYGGHKGGA